MNALCFVKDKRPFKVSKAINFRNYNIVCISETWLNKNLFDNKVNLKDYAVYRKDQSSEGRKNSGGVLLAINDINSFRNFKNDVDGSLTCEEIIEESTIYVFVLYNQPIAILINMKLQTLPKFCKRYHRK